MVKITDKQYIADHNRALLGTLIHQVLGDFRAGVEGVPSVLRRVYGIDKVPLRGLTRYRIWNHGKIMAFKFQVVLRTLHEKRGKCPVCLFCF